MSKNKKPFWETQEMNDKTFVQYYNRLLELAVNMFEWKNLPDSVDPRFLELTLFGKGYSVFFRDDELEEYLALTCAIGGKWNLYNIPISRRAYATNGYSKNLDNTNSVLIYNNYQRTNSMLDIEMYAKRLAQIERTIDVNVHGQKTPLIITCDETQRLTLKNMYKQIDDNEFVIFGSKNLDLQGIKVLRTDVPYVADKLNTLKNEIWNEALTYLGISNVNAHKKERLLVDEVQRNMGGVEAQKYTRLNARKEACKQINKMFGLNIDVEYRDTIKMLTDDELIEPENDVKEGEENE